MTLTLALVCISIILFAAVIVLFRRNKSHADIRKLIHHLPTGAVLRDGNDFIINKGVEKITGYKQCDFPDLNSWFEKLYGDKSEELLSLYHETISSPVESFLVQLRRKDGEFRQVIFDAYRDEGWEVWILQDVTQHLVDSEKFKILFETSSDAYTLFDENGIVDCNPKTLQLLGLSRKEEFLKLHPADFSPEYQPCGMKSSEKSKLMDEIAINNGSHSFEWTHKTVTGQLIPVLVTLTRVEINNKKMLFVVWHDLTEIKESQAMVMHTSKMSALGEMAAGLAHELNNPLAIIKGSVYVTRLTIEDWETSLRTQVEKHLVMMDSTITRMTKIIKGLRDFSRDNRHDEPFEKVSLNDVLQETLNFCGARLKNHSVALRINVPQEIEINCRPVQISQVILNLLNNSCDAISQDEQKWIEISAQDNGSHISILVSDSGGGIPKHVADKIMEPFFTTKGPKEGTGLGLSISRQIIEKHLGKLTIRQDLKNTTFEIILPSPETGRLAG